MEPGPKLANRGVKAIATLGVALGAALLWLFWPALLDMHVRWSVDPRYSHGYLVAPFAFYLLWHRRELAIGLDRPSAWGAVLVGLGLAMKLASGYYFIPWLEGVSLLPCLAGMAVMLGGWAALRWSWPSIAFLFFMIPLPYRLEMSVGGPLQMIATRASTYALQTFGLPALAQGFVIEVGDARIGVVEACNGLGMLMMFLAYASAAAIVIERPVLDRIAIVLSAVPIALLANITRITVTGLLHVTVGGEWADRVYHDLAGWLMMPLALATLWLEVQILSRMFIEIEAAPSKKAMSPVYAGVPPIRPRPSRGRG